MLKPLFESVYIFEKKGCENIKINKDYYNETKERELTKLYGYVNHYQKEIFKLEYMIQESDDAINNNINTKYHQQRKKQLENTKRIVIEDHMKKIDNIIENANDYLYVRQPARWLKESNQLTISSWKEFEKRMTK